MNLPKVACLSSMLTLLLATFLVAKDKLPTQHFDTSDIKVATEFYTHAQLWYAARIGCRGDLNKMPKQQPESQVVSVPCQRGTEFVDNDEWRKMRQLALTVLDLREK